MSINKGSLVLGIVCLSLLAGCAKWTPQKTKPSMRQNRNQASSITHGVGESTEFIEKEQIRAESLENKDKQENQAQNTNRDQDTYFFAFDRFEVAEHDLASIQAHADYLVKHPKTKIYIYGHTDERGSREYNIALGERRSKAVARILSSLGVSANQIKIVSYGAEKPAMQGNNEDAYSKNRRAQTVYE